MDWIHNGKPMLNRDDFTEDVAGFIYNIKYADGREYIGRKNLESSKKRHFGKKEIEKMTNKRLKKWEWVTTESDWKTYSGSTKKSKGLEVVSKTIIELCRNKVNISYCEDKWLIRLDVLCSEKYLNDCIGGRYYSGKIDKGL